MGVVVITRAKGFTIDVDGHTTHLRDDQAHELSNQLRDALRELSEPKPRAVTPAKWRAPKP
jgi:hypothetical protein